jgi:hypothetical protein
VYGKIRCENDGSTVPRVGCRCRGCCMTRERAIDPRLAALAYEPPSLAVTCHAQALIHRQLQRYIMGDLALEALPIEIIKVLSEVIGYQQKQLSDLISMQPPLHFLFNPAAQSQPE